MNSSVIGKVEKARRYAQERDRMQVKSLAIHFNGDIAAAGIMPSITCSRAIV